MESSLVSVNDCGWRSASEAAALTSSARRWKNNFKNGEQSRQVLGVEGKTVSWPKSQLDLPSFPYYYLANACYAEVTIQSIR